MSTPAERDLDRLRRNARNLKRAVLAGDEVALQRVRAYHPEYRHRPDRIGNRPFTLRDAQAVIARELGHDGWTSMVKATGARPRLVQHATVDMGASASAHRRGQRTTSVLNVYEAVLESPETAAAKTLVEAGLTPERLALALDGLPKAQGIGTLQSLLVRDLAMFASGLAAAAGRTRHSHEDLVVAIALIGVHTDAFEPLDVDPVELAAIARRHGIDVPLDPPELPRARGGFGPRVVIAREDFPAVSRALREQYPPDGDTSPWGMNHTDDGRVVLLGEIDIDLPRRVVEILGDPARVEVLPVP